jgi:hypothetical protein
MMGSHSCWGSRTSAMVMPSYLNKSVTILNCASSGAPAQRFKAGGDVVRLEAAVTLGAHCSGRRMLGQDAVRHEIAVETYAAFGGSESEPKCGDEDDDGTFEEGQALQDGVGVGVVGVVVAPHEQPLLRLALPRLHKLQHSLHAAQY